MAQPGSNEEGKDDEKETSTCDYKCVFRKADDSIYIMVKDTKSKRAFSNTFSKSALLAMDLKQQSIDEIITMLEAAKSGSDSSLKFQIVFGDAENTKNVSIDKLSKSYVKGYAAYIIISIQMKWLNADYNFKLLEQSYVNINLFYNHLHVKLYDSDIVILLLLQNEVKQIFCMILLLICSKKLIR